MASLKFRHYATESALKGTNNTVQDALNAFDVGTIVFIDDTQKQYIITSKSNNVVTYKIYYGRAAVVGVSGSGATRTLTFSDGSEIAVKINNVEHATSADTANTAKSIAWANVTNKPNLVTTDTEQTITGAKIFNNNTTFKNETDVESLTADSLLVTGSARFTNIINGNLKGNVEGNLTGNASTATKATNDGNGNTITSTYATKTERANNDITAASLTATKLTLTRTAGNITANIPTWNQDTTGTAAKATADAKGNNIVNTYATKAEVAALPKSMVIKGTLDATHALPTSGMTEGDTYIVGASGTYNNIACKVGDFFVRTSNSWLRIPAGDEWEYNENTIKGIKVNNAGHADTADTAVSAGSATTASACTGNAATATTATTATKIGTSTVGSAKMPVYINSGTPTAISSFPEANLSWGGKNFAGSYGPIDAAMIPDIGACRSMFAKAAGITVQYSRDGGATWIDYGLTDTQKTALFSVGQSVIIGGTPDTGIDKSNYKSRVIVTTDLARIYTILNKIAIFLSTDGSSGCNVTIDARTKANVDAGSDTWTTLADSVPVKGWTGWNIINIPNTTTFGNSSGQYQQIRFTFGVTSHASTVSYPGLLVNRIMMFGGVGWMTPSNMARDGHLYAYDSSQNATFPAAITSTMFKKSGGTSSQFLKADGSVDSSTYSKLGHTHTGSEVKLTGYSKASSYSAIAASDTVNQAIGKLEGAISGLENLLASI